MPFAARDPDLLVVALTDPRFGRQINRFKYLAGRAPLPGRADEVLVPFLLARQRHLHVGSLMDIHGPATPAGPPSLSLRVVGIEAAALEFPPNSVATLPAYVSPAFLAAHPQWSVPEESIVEVAVRLRHGGADVAGLRANLLRAAGHPVGMGSVDDQSRSVKRSMSMQGLALWLMAGFAALAAALILLQLLIRQFSEDSADDRTAAALGMTPGERFTAGMLPVVVIAVLGSVVALVGAALASPLFPLGTAGIAEPHPGLRIDARALSLGAVAVIGAVLALGALAAARANAIQRRAEVASERPPASLRAAGRFRLPLPLATGLWLALRGGRGRRSAPVRATFGALAVGVMATVAALTFGAGLSHLLATPSLYGSTFDALVQANGNFGDVRPAIAPLRGDPTVAAVRIADDGIPMQASKARFDVQAGANLKGAIVPTLLAGRVPEGPDEILLGSDTMRALRTRLGRSISLRVAGYIGPVSMRVVGRGVLAATSDTEQLGKGGVITSDGEAAFAAKAPAGFALPPPGDIFVRFRSGTDPAAGRATLERRLGADGRFIVTAPLRPADVTNLAQIRRLPLALAGVLAALGTATLGYLLLSGVRRWRRDFAVLKAMGFVGSQVRATLLWHATVVAGAGLAVGLPLGIVIGRWGWTYVANRIGAVAAPVVPLGLLAMFPLVVLIANIVAFEPALAAARSASGPPLRTE
ncbi:MAG: ABC transporter permease [Acetobacteraceae bacterium]|nr:ABC transporter permease [Acetobacteraceae bacterium]